MDTELLKTFIEVKHTRHFGKAAENLYLTQAAVSARIKQLETILGAPLFTRFRNNLQLTVTGERFVYHAETILSAWERARQDVELKKHQTHALSLGATSGLWDLLVQDALHQIHSSFPELMMRAEAHAPELLIRGLLERTLDLAIIYEPAKSRDLISIPITPADLILVSTQQNQTVNEALASGYVSVDWGFSFQINFSQLFPDAEPPVLHTSLARIAFEFVLAFGGSAYLPYRMIENNFNAGLYQVTDAPVISRQLFACYHPENIYLKDIAAVVDIIGSLILPIDDGAGTIEL